MNKKISPSIIVALDFGKSFSKNSANYYLAEYIRKQYSKNTVIYAQSFIYKILRGFGDKKFMKQVHEVSSLGSNISGKVNAEGRLGDSFEVLEDVSKVVPKSASIVIIAQKHHAPRIKRQAEKIGFHAEIPSNLPDQWSRHDEQTWVRGFFAWWFRELFIARPKLKKDNRM